MNDRIKQTGEVFTPRSLIREMLNKLPNEVWFDPNKTWLEPAAGDGNFLVEVKARLMQANHDEKHILDNMLFSIELIDDNHWVLQHRLGYLIDGNPNPLFWPESEYFDIGKIHPIAQDLNNNNPYIRLGLEKDEVLFHRNHVCTTALDYDMSFGRKDGDDKELLPMLEIRDLGEWPITDTPDIGETYIVERVLGKQPQLCHAEVAKVKEPKSPKIKAPKLEKVKAPKLEKQKKSEGGGWSVHPNFYGQNKEVKTEYDGHTWVALHDDLVDDINASLKRAGKHDLFEKPRAFGASSGLRGGKNSGLFKKI